MLLSLALRSLRYRWHAVLLTLLSVVLSVMVVLGVEHIRHQVRHSFTRTVSGIDLIVGARSGPLNVLLSSVFRIGHANNNIHWESYQHIISNPQVAWSIPLSLGDSHRGYRVLGTTHEYFEHFQYAQKQALVFAEGREFTQRFEVVLGAEVATQLGYSLDDELVLAHGLGHTSFSQHDEHPFHVVGVLAATGTPVDQTLHISLDSMEAIHSHGVLHESAHAKEGGDEHHHEHAHHHESDHDMHSDHHTEHNVITPKHITAFMLGLKVKAASLIVQRQINEFTEEPLTAVLPGVALAELWQVMKVLENTLRLVSVFIAMASLLGLSAVLMALLRERRDEMQLLRIIGAPSAFILLLVELEAVLLTLLGVVMGSVLLYLLLRIGSNFLSQRFGLSIDPDVYHPTSLWLMVAMVLIAAILAFIPAWSAYRKAV